jgi:hypothetical protein
VDVEQLRTIGQRLREIRYWRGKSLRVVAELAGISESYLSRLEPVGKWSRGLLILSFRCRRYGAGSAPSHARRDTPP